MVTIGILLETLHKITLEKEEERDRERDRHTERHTETERERGEKDSHTHRGEREKCLFGIASWRFLDLGGRKGFFFKL